MLKNRSADISDQLALMTEDACYDVSDSEGARIDMAAIGGIKSPSAAVKVPKMFLSNDCVFNCAYCGCRNSREERQRYCNDPKVLARLAVARAEESGHGVFITSAIHKNADYTEELIIETLKSIRNDLMYDGYVHAKIMPGVDPLLIKQAGMYADRLSINIETARSEGYSLIAKQKNKNNILTPMKQISDMIAAAKQEKGRHAPKFATSQSTQLMAGSTGEDDRTILYLSKALYKKYGLKRVYYTAFQYIQQAKGYELDAVTTPPKRVHRLYQADRLMELYGFTPDEIAPPSQSSLAFDLDPKLSWALRNLDLFPVELNTADYETLIRVPGIGITYARKILQVRKYCKITFEALVKIRVPISKSRYFITCSGKYIGGIDLNTDKLRSILTDNTNFEQLILPSF